MLLTTTQQATAIFGKIDKNVKKIIKTWLKSLTIYGQPTNKIPPDSYIHGTVDVHMCKYFWIVLHVMTPSTVKPVQVALKAGQHR